MYGPYRLIHQVTAIDVLPKLILLITDFVPRDTEIYDNNLHIIWHI